VWRFRHTPVVAIVPAIVTAGDVCPMLPHLVEQPLYSDRDGLAAAARTRGPLRGSLPRRYGWTARWTGIHALSFAHHRSNPLTLQSARTGCMVQHTFSPPAAPP